MSNIGTAKIPFSSDYQSLETLLNTSFTANTKYTIQVDGDVKLCEASSKPSAGGFRINFLEPFEFEYDGTNGLWVKPLSFFKDSYITVAD